MYVWVNVVYKKVSELLNGTGEASPIYLDIHDLSPQQTPGPGVQTTRMIPINGSKICVLLKLIWPLCQVIDGWARSKFLSTVTTSPPLDY